jgi:putative N-acetylmannosamine-6-phosphate epimerase
MKYNYTLEHDLPISITVTLHDVEKLIAMLEPIAEDATNSHRYKASELCRNLKDIRKSALATSSSQLTYEYERLVKDGQ